MDFMDPWGPSSDILWRPVAGFCHGVWTLLLVYKIRSSDDHKDLWFLAWCSMVLLVCKIRSSDDDDDDDDDDADDDDDDADADDDTIY